jgi:hypothetical protein
MKYTINKPPRSYPDENDFFASTIFENSYLLILYNTTACDLCLLKYYKYRSTLNAGMKRGHVAIDIGYMVCYSSKDER